MEGKFTPGVRRKGRIMCCLNSQTSKIALAVDRNKDNKHGVGDGMQQAIDYAILFRCHLLTVPMAMVFGRRHEYLA